MINGLSNRSSRCKFIWDFILEQDSTTKMESKQAKKLSLSHSLALSFSFSFPSLVLFLPPLCQSNANSKEHPSSFILSIAQVLMYYGHRCTSAPLSLSLLLSRTQTQTQSHFLSLVLALSFSFSILLSLCLL